MPKKIRLEDSEEAFWEIVEKGSNTKGHIVETGDIIRIGRALLKINQVNITEVNKPVNDLIITSIKEHIKVDKLKIEMF